MQCEHSDPEFYFKDSLFGLILMIKVRTPAESPGEWNYFYRKAKAFEAPNIRDLKRL